MKTCPSCQLPNEDAAVACPRCRADLTQIPRGSRKVSFGRSVAAGAAGLGALALLGALCFGLIAAGAPAPLVVLLNLGGWVGCLFVVAWVRDPEAPFSGSNLGWSALTYLIASSVVGVIGFGIALVFLATAFAKSSCPHVWSSNGERLALDADPLSGAFMRGAERDDLVRLERLGPVAGRYKLQLWDELPEKDVLDSIALVVVDHDPTLDVLPTQAGAILGVRGGARPTAALDRAGADRLASVIAPDDGAFFASTDSASTYAEELELRFARPDGGAPVALALRAHSTPFAEESLARYLASMGPGLGPLLALADDPGDPDFKERIAGEIARLGLPMSVELADGDGAPFRAVARLDPVGPAVQRTQAVALPALAAGAVGPVRVRLRFTRRFWAVDEARLGAAVVLEPAAVLEAASAVGPRGDVRGVLAASDGQRVTLSEGERIAVELAAPPPPVEGRARTVLLRVRGYYEPDLGRGVWANPGAMVGHQLGLLSLPKLAERLAVARPDLVASAVR